MRDRASCSQYIRKKACIGVCRSWGKLHHDLHMRSLVGECALEQKGPQAVHNQREVGLSDCTKEVCNKCEVFDLCLLKPNNCSKQSINSK